MVAASCTDLHAAGIARVSPAILGNVIKGEDLPFEIEFSNVGKDDLDVELKSLGCGGCTIAPEERKATIAPQGNHKFPLVFHSDGVTPGEFNKHVFFLTSDPDLRVIRF